MTRQMIRKADKYAMRHPKGFGHPPAERESVLAGSQGEAIYNTHRRIEINTKINPE